MRCWLTRAAGAAPPCRDRDRCVWTLAARARRVANFLRRVPANTPKPSHVSSVVFRPFRSDTGKPMRKKSRCYSLHVYVALRTNPIYPAASLALSCPYTGNHQSAGKPTAPPSVGNLLNSRTITTLCSAIDV